MILQSIKIINFKNIKNFESEFTNKITCFTGENGVGKTNILDAIHYLSFTKSFFNTLDLKNINHDEQFFAIHGKFFNNNSIDKVSCIQKENSKKIFNINEKPYKTFSEHIGKFPLIMISPYDRDLINLGSDIRRKFVDMLISQLSLSYLDNLVAYNKVLLQRNILLKQTDDPDYTLIELLNEQLIKYGTVIYAERKSFFNTFEDIFQYYFDIISKSTEKVHIEYVSHLNDESFETLLKNNLQKDLFLKYTSVGIHKDDMIFYMNNYSLKNYASQGQQKSYTTALKLAQANYIKDKKQITPILLLDDIFDKLDSMRVGNLIELVAGEHFGQVFVTDTQTERISDIVSDMKVIKIAKQ